jgi:hypothetical protein
VSVYGTPTSGPGGTPSPQDRQYSGDSSWPQPPSQHQSWPGPAHGGQSGYGGGGFGDQGGFGGQGGFDGQGGFGGGGAPTGPGPGGSGPGGSGAHGRRSRGKAPLILGILGAVGLLCVGLTAAAVLIAGRVGDSVDDPAASDPLVGGTPPAGTSGEPRPSAPAGGGGSPSEGEVQGDLSRYKTGDCLTVSANNTVKPAKCTDRGAYKVLLRRDGTTNDSVCESTDATESMYQDAAGTRQDFVLCIAPVT